MTVSSFDTGSVISPTYRSLFVQAVRQELKLPRPLPIDVYVMVPHTDEHGKFISDETVVPAVAGDYRATIKMDGRITQSRVVGGARTKPFDDAVLAAIRAAGDSQAAPLFGEPIKGDSVEVRLKIRVVGTVTPRDKPDPPNSVYVPLFTMRVPSFGPPSSQVKADSTNPRPRYPGIARQAGAEANMIAEYIVTRDGRADIGSLQVARASATQFVEALLDVLPKYRYAPLMISGCAVPSLVQMPFIFQLLK